MVGHWKKSILGIRPLGLLDIMPFWLLVRVVFLGRCFLESVNLKDCWCVFFFLFFVGLCVSWQHTRLCGVRLRHGRGGQHVHGAVQRAEISRLHLDAFSWGEGSQAEVQKQLINRSALTHTQTSRLSHTHTHTHRLGKRIFTHTNTHHLFSQLRLWCITSPLPFPRA